MKEYTVVYLQGTEEYARDNFIDGTTISDIVEELTYEINRYGVDYDEIAIFNSYDDEAATIYYEVVNIYGHYILAEMV